MKKIVLILALMILITPVMALETLTKDNFATPDTEIKPEKSYYFPGDELSVEYVITPKNDDDMVLIGGDGNDDRRYAFSTALNDPFWTIGVNYYIGSKKEDYTGRKVRVDVKYFEIEEGKGVRSIEVNMTGKVPEVSSRLEVIDVVNVSIEEAEEDALPPLTVKVVNTQKFGEDIQKLRDDANSLKSDLDSAGVKYSQSDFDEINSLLDEVQSLVNNGKYLDADSKLKQAEDLLNQIASQADRLKAETIRDELKEKLDDAYLNLSILEVALNKVENSKNYTKYLQSYAELKSQYDSLKKDFDSADDLIGDGKYADAYNSLKDIEDDIEMLLRDTSNLKANVEAEAEKTPTGGFSLPGFEFNLPISPLYLVGIIVGAVVVVVIAIKLKGRRGKWDELR